MFGVPGVTDDPRRLRFPKNVEEAQKRSREMALDGGHSSSCRKKDRRTCKPHDPSEHGWHREFLYAAKLGVPRKWSRPTGTKEAGTMNMTQVAVPE